MSVLSLLPASVANIIQTGTLERELRDALTPSLLFLGECNADEIMNKIGEDVRISKKGLLASKRRPSTPGVDPTPSDLEFESVLITLNEWDDSVDTDLLRSALSITREFVVDAKTLMQGGLETANRVIRMYLFRAYNAGNTTASAAGNNSTSLPVQSVNGLTSVMVNGRETDVSALNPLGITLGSTSVNVTGYALDDADNPFGPGTLTLESAQTWAQYALVKADDAPVIYRPNNRATAELIQSTDVIAALQFQNAVARLKTMRVPKFPDNYYHAHVTPTQMVSLVNDTKIQNLLNSNLTAEEAKQGVVFKAFGCKFFENEGLPDSTNCDSGDDGVDEIGGILTNATNGVNVQRAVVLGDNAIDQRYLPVDKIYGEANGDVGIKATPITGGFTDIGSAAALDINGLHYVIRPPLDRKQRKIAQTYSLIAGFGCQTDSLTGDAARRKRAVVIETA